MNRFSNSSDMHDGSLERSLAAYGSVIDDAIAGHRIAGTATMPRVSDNGGTDGESAEQILVLTPRTTIGRRFISGRSVAALTTAAAATILMIAAVNLTSQSNDVIGEGTTDAAATGAGAAADTATTTGSGPSQLGPEDIVYQGAFLFPDDDAWGSSGHAMTYVPDGDPSSGDDHPGSLVVAGKKTDRTVGELTIPTPVISDDPTTLPEAEVLRAPVDITQGRIECPFTCESVELAGLAYVQEADRIAWNVRDWYNAAAANLDSLGWSRPDFTDAAGPWHIGPRTEDFHSMKTSDYLFTAPKSFADEHLGGRRLIAGNHREGGNKGGSQGPTLFALAPWQDGDLTRGAEVGATQLLTYPFVQECLGDPTACSFPDYRAADKWGGAVWVDTEDHKGLMMVGRKGVGSTCYGVPGLAYPDGNQIDGVDDCRDKPNDPEIMCPGDKGWNSGPFTPMMLFYSTDDLAEVAAGQRSPDSVVPVSTHVPSETVDDSCGLLESVTYDSERGLIYVAESNAVRYGRTVVHVWQLTADDDPTSPTTTTSTPASTTTTNSSSTSSPSTTSTSTTVTDPATGVEVLNNPELDDGMDGGYWTNLPETVGDSQVCVDIPAGTSDPWDAAFGQARFALNAGQTYRLEVDISSNRSGTGQVEVQELGGGYFTHFSAEVNVTGDQVARTSTFEFTAPRDEPLTALTFNFGGEFGAAELCFDRVSLLKLG